MSRLSPFWLGVVPALCLGHSPILAEENPWGASARIEIRPTPAGHAGAEVTLKVPSLPSLAIASWGEPLVDEAQERIILNATSGASGVAADGATHLYRLLEVAPPIPESARCVAFRRVRLPGGVGSMLESHVVLRSLEEWHEWVAPYDMTAGPLPPRPPVDFDTEMFVAVFLGRRPVSHEVEIGRLLLGEGDTLQVDHAVAIPAGGKPAAEELVDLYDAVALPLRRGSVEFVRAEVSLPGRDEIVPVVRPEALVLLPEDAMTVVIRSEAAWWRFLDRVVAERDPILPPPPVDLSTKMLIGTFLGRTPLGQSVRIEEVRDTGSEWRVRVEKVIGGVPPPPDEFAYPYDLVAVPRRDLPVSFERTEIALASPPPSAGELRAAAQTKWISGNFEVVFQLDGCPLATQKFFLPGAVQPGRPVLDALSENDESLAIDAVFDLSESAVAHWGVPVLEGSNLRAQVMVLPRPLRIGDDGGASFPARGTASHRYRFEGLAPGVYRFQLEINGATAGHVYFRHPSSAGAQNEYEAWLEKLLVRPVWEPSPVAGPLGDLDGDGFEDFLEYALGSDPLDPVDVPGWSVRHFFRGGGQSPRGTFTLSTRAGVEVDVETSSDLMSWEKAAVLERLAEPTDEGGERLTLSWDAAVGAGESSGYARLKCRLRLAGE